jgi:predicted nucleotidyltransferase component of viral defense system
LITLEDVVARATQWGVSAKVVEKDYVLGWLLWGLGNQSQLTIGWALKGGACIKKCFVETYRFSDDLDFTVLPGGPRTEAEIKPLLEQVLRSVSTRSGLGFDDRVSVKERPGGRSFEVRIYFRGPRQTPQWSKIKIDLTLDEVVVRPPILQDIFHPYPDNLPVPAQMRCYSFDEVFAEKIRAMSQRSRPRDVYDVVNLIRRDDLRLYPTEVSRALKDKCRTKSVALPSLESFEDQGLLDALANDWAPMLQEQLPIVPPLEQFIDELPYLFGWLEGDTEEVVLDRIGTLDEDYTWTPPPTVATWSSGVPIEVIRFAATNRLLVRLGYQGRTRLIEAYSLRQSSEGAILLHAEKSGVAAHRTYRLDRIVSVEATIQPFSPRHYIEFSSQGPFSAPPQRRRHLGRRTSTRTPRKSVRRRG